MQTAPAPEPVAEPASTPASPTTQPSAVAAASGADLTQLQAGDWIGIVEGLKLGGMARQLAMHCHLIAREGELLRLALPPVHQSLRSDLTEQNLSEALSDYYGVKIRLEIESQEAESETPAQREQRLTEARQQQAQAQIDNDPNVIALQEQMGARVRPDSVRPLN